MEHMDRSALLALHAYNDYANCLVLDTADGMSVEELTRNVSPSHGTVKELLLHIALCEYSFILHCNGTPIENADENFDHLDIGGIRMLFSRVAALRKSWLENASEENLKEVLNIQIRQQPLKLARWQMLVQSLLHSIHHRGELSIVMTGLGYPLPTLDPILMYIRESGQEWPYA